MTGIRRGQRCRGYPHPAQKAALQEPAYNRPRMATRDVDADGSTGDEGVCALPGVWVSDCEKSFSGGAGNRTPVPKYFRVGFYVCSLSMLGRPPRTEHAAFITPGSGRQDPGATIGQNLLTGTAAEAGSVAPSLKFLRA